MTLTVGSLFSGIGGIDLGLERAGMTVKWQSEIDPFACKVLKKHWPNIPNLGDIKTVDWSTVEPVDLIAGGYPCQPFSTAGKRQGENDPRHLWPYFLRAISELRPRFALLENVRGHLTMGFDRVLGDLAEIGYDAEWQIVSAASVGAPHRRDRIICVAYPSEQYGNGKSDNAGNSMGSETLSQSGNSGRSTNVAYPNNAGNRTSERGTDSDWTKKSQERQQPFVWTCGRCSEMAHAARKFVYGRDDQLNQRKIRERETIQVASGGGDRVRYNGNEWWETEPDVGRVAHGIPARVDRLRGLGNAVVPQVAEYVGRLILQSLN